MADKLFLDTAINCEALQFGKFTLKSGRISPYFFNLGKYKTGRDLSFLAEAYARTILNEKIEFDVLFGPAYKGIPLAALASAKIAEMKPELGSIEYAYNRKEKKDHGEGGSMVGADLKGRKVLIIDDVITAGTAANEAIELIKQAGGNVVGMVVALNREERINDKSNIDALHQLGEEHSMKAFSISTFSDVVERQKSAFGEEQFKALVSYMDTYCVKK